MKKNTKQIAGSTLASYGAFKLTQRKIDPYTILVVAIIIGVILIFFAGKPLKMVGVGVLTAGALQAADVAKGAKLIKNESPNDVFVIEEDKTGVHKFTQGKVPDFPIEGFTYKGLNGVYKVSDGVYAKIDKDNTIKTVGLSTLVNKVKGAGFKDADWVNKQMDLRWKDLYDHSIL